MVSVVVPAYNAAAFLANAIASIQAQQVVPIEIIVVDDGSTDGTAKLAAGFGNAVRCVRQKNLGPAAARNTGLRAAGGDVIAFLDADDVWPPGSLATSLEYLMAVPQRKAVTGRVQLMRANAAGEWKPYRDPGYVTSLPAGIYRREVFDHVGMLDPALRQGEDVDWFLRAREAGVQVEKIETITLHYRLRRNSVTGDKAENRRYFLTALKRSLDRRRGG